MTSAMKLIIAGILTVLVMLSILYEFVWHPDIRQIYAFASGPYFMPIILTGGVAFAGLMGWLGHKRK